VLNQVIVFFSKIIIVYSQVVINFTQSNTSIRDIRKLSDVFLLY